MKKTQFVIFTILLLMPMCINAEQPQILINEIAWMGTVDSGTNEWIELKNTTSGDIDLTGWRLEATDGSPTINLEGSISADGFFILERTDDDSAPEVTADQFYTGSLSNSGEWLKLYDAENNLVDEINGNDAWPAGDNSTKQTLERNETGWQNSEQGGGTPKAQNSTNSNPPDPPSDDNTDDQQPADQPDSSTPKPPATTKVNKGDILITEIFPNPSGIDIHDEFVEIKNVSKGPIDLTGFKIKNYAKQIFIIPSLKMMPNSIVVFYRWQTNLALNNNKEKVTLYSKSNRIVDQVEYKSSAPENESYQRNEKKIIWQEISPGKDCVVENIILPTAIISGPSQAEINQIISFDGSDSFDPESRKLKFNWDFGDGRKDSGIFVRQVYLQPGNYEVLLNVTVNEQASSTEKFKIKITGEKLEEVKEEQSTPTTTATTATTQPAIFEQIPFIFISEFLPNPEGADGEGEFIEIFNQDNTPVNLTGFKLDDVEGGSKPFVIPAGTIIKPGQYLAFFRPETKIALNNKDENVRLLMPDDTIIDLAEYEESKEGLSFVLDEQFSWQQSETPTPGEINVLDVAPEDEEDGEDDKTEEKNKTQPKVLGVETKEEIEDETENNKNKYIVSGISAIMILGLGTFLKMKNKN